MKTTNKFVFNQQTNIELEELAFPLQSKYFYSNDQLLNNMFLSCQANFMK